ncbi:hypothetical protein NPIL_348101, partial [Nephila pilipes]
MLGFFKDDSLRKSGSKPFAGKISPLQIIQ